MLASGNITCTPKSRRDTRHTAACAQVFCPKCEDIYFPRSEYQCSIDGAYFGTTFPHLLLMSYPMYRPPKSSDVYVPRVFGFKLHPSAYGERCAQCALPAHHYSSPSVAAHPSMRG